MSALTEEEEQHRHSDTSNNDVQVVRPSPSCCGVLDERACDYRSKSGEWNRGEEQCPNTVASPFGWQQLRDDDSKGELDAGRNTDESIAHDELGDYFRCTSDD